jgi:ATP-dependent helicase YprA (DUF1998 family)
VPSWGRKFVHEICPLTAYTNLPNIWFLVFDIAWMMEQDRRRIERDFFDGKLCGIAATNALELGIDVGHIDVTLHLGFPGSIAR